MRRYCHRQIEIHFYHNGRRERIEVKELDLFRYPLLDIPPFTVLPYNLRSCAVPVVGEKKGLFLMAVVGHNNLPERTFYLRQGYFRFMYPDFFMLSISF